VEGLTVTRPAADVTEGDVDAMVQNLREQRPKFEIVDRVSRETDRVTMDFIGLVDGEPFEGSKGEDVAVLLGGGRMLKDFENGVLGMKAGEDKQWTCATRRLPQQGAGRESREVRRAHEDGRGEAPSGPRRRVLLEYGVTEGASPSWRSEVTDNMKRRAGAEHPRSREAAAARPAARSESGRSAEELVDAQVREMQIDTGAPDRRQGRLPGGPAPEPFVEPARPSRRARHADRRAHQEPRHQARPRSRPGPPRRPRGGYPDSRVGPEDLPAEPEAMRQVENMVLEDQVVDYLLERARVKDEPATFKDVMNFGA